MIDWEACGRVSCVPQVGMLQLQHICHNIEELCVHIDDEENRVTSHSVPHFLPFFKKVQLSLL